MVYHNSDSTCAFDFEREQTQFRITAWKKIFRFFWKVQLYLGYLIEHIWASWKVLGLSHEKKTPYIFYLIWQCLVPFLSLILWEELKQGCVCKQDRRKGSCFKAKESVFGVWSTREGQIPLIVTIFLVLRLKLHFYTAVSVTTALCKGQCKARHMLGKSFGGPFRQHAAKGPGFPVLHSSANQPW